MTELIGRLDSLAKAWIRDMAPVVSRMTADQRLFVRALTIGPQRYRGTDLPIPWETYDEILDVLRPTGRFDKLVYSGGSLSSVQAEDFPFPLAHKCLAESTSASATAVLDEALVGLHSYLEDDDVPVSLRCDLFGFESDGSVDLSEAVSIVPNTASSDNSIATRVPPAQFCIEARGRVPLRFEDWPSSTLASPDSKTENALSADMTLALHTLMILQKGSFILALWL
jgi:hypothetical protein